MNARDYAEWMLDKIVASTDPKDIAARLDGLIESAAWLLFEADILLGELDGGELDSAVQQGQEDPDDSVPGLEGGKVPD